MNSEATKYYYTFECHMKPSVQECVCVARLPSEKLYSNVYTALI